jgi:hypothetical protein
MYSIIVPLPQNYNEMYNALWGWVPDAIVLFIVSFIFYKITTFIIRNSYDRFR